MGSLHGILTGHFASFLQKQLSFGIHVCLPLHGAWVDKCKASITGTERLEGKQSPGLSTWHQVCVGTVMPTGEALCSGSLCTLTHVIFTSPVRSGGIFPVLPTDEENGEEMGERLRLPEHSLSAATTQPALCFVSLLCRESDSI